MRHPFLSAWLAGLGVLSFALSWPQPNGVFTRWFPVIVIAGLVFVAGLHKAWSNDTGPWRPMQCAACCLASFVGADVLREMQTLITAVLLPAQPGISFAARLLYLLTITPRTENVWPAMVREFATGAAWAVLVGVAVSVIRASRVWRSGRNS